MSDRLCAWCDLPMVRRATESPSHWSKRMFCSHACAVRKTNDRRDEKLTPEQIIRRNIVIDDVTGCWIWQKSGARGYGRVNRNGETTIVSHLAYEAFVGPVGDLHVCHRCDNPPCCNPDHLFLGTAKDNMADMRQKRSNAWNNVKLTEADVEEIRRSTESNSALGRRYGVVRTTISNIRSGISWRPDSLPRTVNGVLREPQQADPQAGRSGGGL